MFKFLKRIFSGREEENKNTRIPSNAGIPAPLTGISRPAQPDGESEFVRVDGFGNRDVNPARPLEKAQLKCAKGEYEGRSVPVFDGDTLGRNPKSIIFMDNLTVGRIHCRFSICDGRWFIESFGINGTFINGQKITDFQPVMLESGDVIHICGDEFVFSCERPEGKADEA